MRRLRLFAALVGAAAVAGCGDSAVQEITGAPPSSSIKFFNFSVNGPSVNFYGNEAKLTAVSSTSCAASTDPACLTTGIEATSGTAYGSAGSGGFYTGITPGQYTFTGKIATTTDKGVAIASLATPIAEGKSYSLYLSGFYDPATKKTDAFLVEDALPAKVDYSVAAFRFVNAISNSGPMQLFFRNPTTGVEAPVGSAVAYKAATPFVTFTPDGVFNPGGVVDLIVRAPGNATTLITRTAVGAAFGKVYTVTARGDMTVTSTTATNRPFLDITANR